MAAPAATLTTGLNSYYLIQLIESLSQVAVGYDEDTDDINQDLVLQFLKEGYQRIVSTDTRYPWFQASWTFTTVPDTHTYKSGLATTSAWSPYVAVAPDAEALNLTTSSIRQVINVVNTTNAGNELIYIDQFKAESIWVGSNNVSGIPAYWSLWNNAINLWPAPDSTTYTMNIRGYRQPDFSWLTDSNNSESTAYVDLDPEFQFMLVNFTLARIFQYQEDPEMASVYMRHYETGVAIAKGNLTAPNSNQPLIMSGGLQLNTGYWWSGQPSIGVLPGSPYPIGLIL